MLFAFVEFAPGTVIVFVLAVGVITVVDLP